MQTVSGRLEYLSWDRPWKVGELDAAPHFWDVAESLQNIRAEHAYHRDGYTLRANPEAVTELRHGGRGNGAGLFNADGRFGFSNVAAYLEWSLCALNGRTVNLIVSPSTIFSIEAAAFEEVPEVRFFGEGNMSRGSPDAAPNDEFVKRVCQPGSADCCIFLTAGADGFSCAKFSGSTARLLLDRKAEGTMRASRIGNCRIVGREPS
ncbi:hypothetical protein [Devosia sp. Root105]|uniref:hypothetical protein n=1 Tax=Devosia sp. Root105 TaxID=1736423 RepID=UPI0007017B6F|nr:hypothetical protein [Devosia sp. Root105]KQU96478.1 hypothetical protein ASC68_13955 [Devosia sp. Root105]